MPYIGEVGKVGRVYHATQVSLTIPAFSSLSSGIRDYYECQCTSFAGEKLYFEIYPGGFDESSEGYVCLLLSKKDYDSRFSVKYKVGLKLADGTVENVIPEESFTLEPVGIDGTTVRYSIFYQRKELLRRLAPSDTLTLVFTFRRSDSFAEELIELEKLSEDFENLRADKKSCDATLVVKGKEFQVHKSVLISRSPVFAAMFRHDMAEKETGSVDIPDCDEKSFGTFLGYLYSGRAVNVSFSCALELYRTAHKYEVRELRSYCAQYLARNLTVKGVTQAVVLADQYDEDQLMSAVQNFFNNHFDEVIVTKEWEYLSRRDFRLANKLTVGASNYFSALKQQFLLEDI